MTDRTMPPLKKVPLLKNEHKTDKSVVVLQHSELEFLFKLQNNLKFLSFYLSLSLVIKVLIIEKVYL